MKMSRGWISRLQKNHTTFKFAHDLPVAVFLAMGFAKKKLIPEVIKLLNSFFFWKNINGVYKFGKKYFWLENKFFAKTIT